MSIMSRLFGSKEKSAGGGYNLPISGGFLPADSPWNFWQQGKDVQQGSGQTATVHACVDAYSQTLATLYGEHYKYDKKDVKTRKKNSNLADIFHRPNSYQSRSDLMLNLTKNLLLSGNAYLVGIRDASGGFGSVHVLPSKGTQPYVEPDTKAVFYALGENQMVNTLNMMIPARDVMHLRLYTPRHPLIGVSPILNAASSIAANSAMSAHQATFFNQMSRPSGLISTDEKLNSGQMDTLRQAWDQQSQGLNSGRIPVLAGGLKWQSLSLSSQDSQLAEAFSMTVADIARAFRMPLAMIQHHDAGSTYANAEELSQQWLAQGLGFLLEHTELAFDRFFDLPRDEFTEFDTQTLLRTDFSKKVEGFSKLIQNGLYSPNEARMAFNGMPPVEHGDSPMVQQQMVKLGWQDEQAAIAAAGAKVTPAPEPVVDPPVDPEAAKGANVHYLMKAMNQ